MAVLPQGHPLASQGEVTLAQLAREPIILLDEGQVSVALSSFRRLSLVPRIRYEVTDDYSILAMVREGPGGLDPVHDHARGLRHGVEAHRGTPQQEHRAGVVGGTRSPWRRAASPSSSWGEGWHHLPRAHPQLGQAAIPPSAVSRSSMGSEAPTRLAA